MGVESRTRLAAVDAIGGAVDMTWIPDVLETSSACSWTARRWSGRQISLSVGGEAAVGLARIPLPTSSGGRRRVRGGAVVRFSLAASGARQHATALPGLPRAGAVSLELFDVVGRCRVRIARRRSRMSAGAHEITLDARYAARRRVPRPVALAIYAEVAQRVVVAR